MSIAIKRLQNELKDFNNPTYSNFFVITPQENPLEWHFTMKGGKGTDYSEGIYHGRIVFPENYPNSCPPKIFFLNQSGRFEKEFSNVYGLRHMTVMISGILIIIYVLY